MRDLKMPTNQRLSFLQKYCDMLSASTLPESLAAWERARSMILVREGLLLALKECEKLPGHADPADDETLDVGEMGTAVLPPHRQGYLREMGYWLQLVDFWVRFKEAHQEGQQGVAAAAGEAPPLPTRGLKRRCVMAWVEAMLRRITEDLKLLLQHIDYEHHDDVTYRGRSYLKILGVLHTRPGLALP